MQGDSRQASFDTGAAHPAQDEGFCFISIIYFILSRLPKAAVSKDA